MIKNIITAIANAIAKEYPDTPVYHEKAPQEEAKWGFYIHLASFSHAHFLNNRYKREQTFDIHYVPKKAAQELPEIYDNLVWVLELISFDDGLIRGTGMRGEMVDDVLHFLVDYNMFVYKKEEQLPKMTKLEIGQRSD